jgi:crotonobetainyl-CoA:carnitine CoA-transferase CaiB-like acyl-CoA transferase
MLDGITVLDLASVGPAARASRWLADYGADVVKVGPVPSREGVQIVPPFYSYSAHRGMRRARFDLKLDAGRDAFLRLADTADVVIESFRPGVVDRLGVGYAAVSARNPRIVYCSTRASARTDRTRSGRATTSTTSRSAATSTAPAAPPTGTRRSPARRSPTARVAACTR